MTMASTAGPNGGAHTVLANGERCGKGSPATRIWSALARAHDR